MDVAITKMSSKGQVVIPADMRKGFKKGEKLVIIRNGKQLIVKKASSINENFKDDMEFAKRTEAAYRRYEKGLFKKSTKEEFLKELESW